MKPSYNKYQDNTGKIKLKVLWTRNPIDVMMFWSESISERKLYNDQRSAVCKKYTSLKLQALRQCSEVLSTSERNLHSARSFDICK